VFDIGASELLLVVVIAIIVIGPKDLPLALRSGGRWLGKVRRVSGHFRSGIETLIQEAELEETKRKQSELNYAPDSTAVVQNATSPSASSDSSTDSAAEPRLPFGDRMSSQRG
jgi:sec-independent protein translocase protein TatB